MDAKLELGNAVLTAARAAISDGVFPQVETLPDVFLEVPPRKELGDFATNFAMQTARLFRMSPRKIAAEIVARVNAANLDRMDIAGAGFINFYLKGDVIYEELRAAMARGDGFGTLPMKKVPPTQVEYVSANPTGLLHVGHGRGAAFGSALVNLLRAAGLPTQSEYYINDAGNQMNNLAESLDWRYRELLTGETVEPLPNWYRGEDIIDTAKHLIERDGDRYLAMPRDERLPIMLDFARDEKLSGIKADLADFRVRFDSFYSERTLHQGKIAAALALLKDKGATYERDGALWLRSTAHGDDKDRVIIRDNGESTYLAADIAYHRDKFERGFGRVIDIWGADHYGYLARVKASLAELGYDPERLTVLFLQMMHLYRHGEQVILSKRVGESMPLRQLMDEIGVDAARYFFVMRSLDSQLDFDLDLAKKQSNDNPVYYIQYAHARIASIKRQTSEAGLCADGADVNLALLTDESELLLIKKILAYPGEIARAADELAPQRVARFAYDLAALFHGFYVNCRIIGVEQPLALARLALVDKAAQVIRHALAILGVSAPSSM